MSETYAVPVLLKFPDAGLDDLTLDFPEDTFSDLDYASMVEITSESHPRLEDYWGLWYIIDTKNGSGPQTPVIWTLSDRRPSQRGYW